MFSIKIEFLPFVTSYHFFELIIQFSPLKEQLLKMSFIFHEKAKSYDEKTQKIELFINSCMLLNQIFILIFYSHTFCSNNSCTKM